MDRKSLDIDVDTILGRLDRSNPDSLLRSIVAELLVLHQAYSNVEARMQALEVAQTFHDQLVADGATLKSAAMPRAVYVDAAFSLPVEYGFYPIEYTASGTPFRWTGPGPTFFFEVFVNREAPTNFRMYYGRIYAKDVKNKVQCLVDGKEIETTTVEVKGGSEVHGVLPARRSAGGTVITFVCPAVSSPAKEGSQDNRQLGLVFHWLRIDPLLADAAEPKKAGVLEPKKADALEPKKADAVDPRKADTAELKKKKEPAASAAARQAS